MTWTKAAEFQIYYQIRVELETLRENKIKGEQIKSCIQVLIDREKASKTFCKLETQNHIEKLSESCK